MRPFIFFFIGLTFSSFGQKKEFDTLFFFGKKYLLEIGDTYKCKPYDFPFAIAENHYKSYQDCKEKYYSAADICNCRISAQFNASGNQVDVYECPDNRTKLYRLCQFIDSVTIDLDKLDKIYIKTAKNKYYIQKTQLKIVYETSIEIINPDISTPDEYLFSELNTSLYYRKVKPKFIIVNDLLYSDNKKNLQLVPGQFIITLK